MYPGIPLPQARAGWGCPGRSVWGACRQEARVGRGLSARYPGIPTEARAEWGQTAHGFPPAGGLACNSHSEPVLQG